MSPVAPIELLNLAAEKLGNLSQEVVFLGGAVVGLLLTDSGGLPPRVTRDVDVAIKLGSSLLDLRGLDHRLLGLGFINDMYGPVCRYLHGSIVIDIIPVDPQNAEGVNRFYPLAFESAWFCTLENGITIKVIDPVCFLGTKMVAFRSESRLHQNDIFLSRDFEDIVRVIDGREGIVHELETAPSDLRTYLAREFASVVKDPYLDEAIRGYVEVGRDADVLARLNALANRGGD